MKKKKRESTETDEECLTRNHETDDGLEYVLNYSMVKDPIRGISDYHSQCSN